MKKVLAVVLVSAMGLSLAACGGKKAKKLTAKEFKKAMKAEDYSVEEGDDDDIEAMEDWQDEDDLDGSVKKSGSKFVADLSGEDDDGDEGGIYLVCVRSGEMVITATTYETDSKTKKKVDSIIDTLCY